MSTHLVIIGQCLETELHHKVSSWKANITDIDEGCAKIAVMEYLANERGFTFYKDKAVYPK